MIYKKKSEHVFASIGSPPYLPIWTARAWDRAIGLLKKELVG